MCFGDSEASTARSIVMVTATETAAVSAEQSATVKRGTASWAYIYIALGFLLSFEGTIIQLITPLRWPYDLIFYVPLFVLTSLVFLASGRFQGWLVRLKTMYEDRFR